MPDGRSAFDIIGPVMIGPSSSHTAGALRLGRMAALLYGGMPQRAKMLLHGSFYHTHVGHGTDLALVAGLLGMETDDARIRDSFALAQSQGMEYSFEQADLGEVHPNSVMFILDGDHGELCVRGASVGAGNIVVDRINDFDVELTGAYDAVFVIHRDRRGVIAGVAGEIAKHDINIAFMRVARDGERTCMVMECDQPVSDAAARGIAALPGVLSVRVVGKID